jgi:hypothetical protein
MEKAASTVIAVGLIGFGAWIIAAEAGSNLFAVWVAIGIIPMATGLLSMYGELNNGSN